MELADLIFEELVEDVVELIVTLDWYFIIRYFLYIKFLFLYKMYNSLINKNSILFYFNIYLENLRK